MHSSLKNDEKRQKQRNKETKKEKRKQRKPYGLRACAFNYCVYPAQTISNEAAIYDFKAKTNGQAIKLFCLALKLL